MQTAPRCALKFGIPVVNGFYCRNYPNINKLTIERTCDCLRRRCGHFCDSKELCDELDLCYKRRYCDRRQLCVELSGYIKETNEKHLEACS